MNRQTVGFVGSALLVVGVFMPMISLPILGSMNYFQNGEGDGTFVLILGVLSAVAVARQRYGALWLTGGASLALLTYAFATFQSRVSDVKANMGSGREDNPFEGFANALLGTVQLQWGFAVLVIGAVMVMVAANMKPASA